MWMVTSQQCLRRLPGPSPVSCGAASENMAEKREDRETLTGAPLFFLGTTVGMNGELLKFLGGWLIWEWATLPAWSAREYTKFVFQCVKA